MADLGGWLGTAEIRFMPYPVATVLQRARRATAHDRPEQALQLSLSTIESALRYISARLLGDLIAQKVAIEPLGRRILCSRASMGDRLQLVGQCAHLLSGEVPALITSRWGGNLGLAASLGRVVQIRNQVAHQRPPTAREATELRVQVEAAAVCLGPLIERLCAERLVSIFRAESRKPDRYFALDWSGPAAALAEMAIELPNVVAAPGDCFILGDSEPLALAPVIVATDDPLEEAADLWILERVTDGKREGDHRATWMNVRRGVEGAPTTIDTGTLLRLGLADSAAADEAPRHTLDKYYFKTTPTLMKRLMSSYVKRSDVEASIRNVLGSHPSASLWITAPPGSGKSTLICSIIRDHQAIHHFVATSEGRNDYGSILRSLIAQLADRLEMDLEPTSDENSLPQQLANLLVESAAAKTRSTLIVAVDALDELGSPEAISRLLRAFPVDLPDRVFLVVSSRPLVSPVTLPRPTEVLNLGPAGIEILDELAKHYGVTLSPATRERAYQATGGNPLFASWALVMLRANPDAELDFQRNLDDFFGPILASAYDSDNDHGTSAVELVLAMLLAAQDPLDIATLCLATGLPRRSILRVITRIASLLTIAGGEVSLAHRLIYQYLSDPRNFHGVDQWEVREAHRRLAAVSLETPAYPQQRRAMHLVASRQFNEVIAEADNELIADVMPAVAVSVAKSDPTSAEELTEALLNSATPSVVRLAVQIIIRLADSDEVNLVQHIARCAGYQHLPKVVRNLIDLQIAHSLGKWDVVSDTAIHLLNDPGQLTNSQEWKLWEGRLALLAGDGLRIKGHHRDALQMYLHAVRAASPSEPMLQFNASFQIADIDYVYGRLSAARARLFELLKFAKQQGLAEARIRILREFGHIEACMDHNEEAVGYYENALALALVARQGRRIAECYVSLAEALTALDPNRAIRLADRGREIAIENSAFLEAGKALYVRANALTSNGSFIEAIADADASIVELGAVGYGSGCAHAHLVRAKALLSNGSYDEAVLAAAEASSYYTREEIYPFLRAEAISLRLIAARSVKAPEAVETIDTYEAIPHLAEIPAVVRRLGIPLPESY